MNVRRRAHGKWDRQWNDRANGGPRCRDGYLSAEIPRKIKAMDDWKAIVLSCGGWSGHGNKLSQRPEEIIGNAWWYVDFWRIETSCLTQEQVDH